MQQMCCLCDLQGPGKTKSIGIRLEGREKKKKWERLLQHQELRIASRLGRQPRRIIISLMMNSGRSICQI